MGRVLLLGVIALMLSVTTMAQQATTAVGDPPQADQITITAGDTGATVIISGAAGAVFPSAQVIVRNLQLGITERVAAAFDGSFALTIAGLAGQPYQIHAVQRTPTGNLNTLTPLPAAGIVIAPDMSQTAFIPVAFGGQVAYGAGTWLADGRLNQRDFSAGQPLSLTLAMTINAPDADLTLPYQFSATLALRRLFDGDGKPLSTAINAGDDWSSQVRADGRPLLGARVADRIVAESSATRLTVDEETGALSFSLRFNTALPADLAAGVYVPVISGKATLSDSQPFDWYANRIFGTTGTGTDDDSRTVIPLVLRVDDPAPPQLAISFEGQAPVDAPYAIAPDFLSSALMARYPAALIIHGDSLLLAALLDDADLIVGTGTIVTQRVRFAEPVVFAGRLLLPLPPSDDSVSTAVSISGLMTDHSGLSYGLSGDFRLRDEAPLTVTPPVTGDDVAFGVRGFADEAQATQAWFDSAAYPALPDIAPVINFPYFSGDVAYLPVDANAGIRPVLAGNSTQQVSIISADGVLRDFVRAPESDVDGRLLIDQSDLRAGDILWLFGETGVDGQQRAYASVAVITAGDAVRVQPAFSAPLLPDADMIVLPTAVRAGQVLHAGDDFVSAGLIAPAVAAEVQTIVTTRTRQRDLSTRANQYGWYHDPALDFTVNETGVYQVTQRAIYDGNTSAGQLAQSVSGTVRGADAGQYWVFVVDADAPLLETTRPPISEVLAGQSFTINVRAPESWTDVSAYVVARTAQEILDQAQPSIFANQTNYTFDPAAAARRFANADANDTVTITLAMTGIDIDGQAVIRARVFTLRGTTLDTPISQSGA